MNRDEFKKIFTVLTPSKQKEAGIEARVKKDIVAMLKDDDVRHFGVAMVLGQQLYSWGAFKLLDAGSYCQEAKTSIQDSISQSMTTPEGKARPFIDVGMLKELEQLLPFLKHCIEGPAPGSDKKRDDDSRSGASCHEKTDV